LLAGGFVEKDGGGVDDVEGIDARGHGDGDGAVAKVEERFGEAETFVAEEEATIVGNVRLMEPASVGVRVGGEASHALRAQFQEGMAQVFGFHHWQFEHGAHGSAHGATQVGAAAGFAD
jgi:hypothetical protein